MDVSICFTYSGSRLVVLVIGVVAVIIGAYKFCMMINNEIHNINGKVD